MDINEITEQTIGAAIAVHRQLGPGLLESTYQACLIYELIDRGLGVEREKPMCVAYRDTTIDCGYRIDVLVERRVIVELKVVERIEPIHAAQILTYLKLSGLHVGLLLNFNVERLRDGLRRFVLNSPHPRPSDYRVRAGTPAGDAVPDTLHARIAAQHRNQPSPPPVPALTPPAPRETTVTPIRPPPPEH